MKKYFVIVLVLIFGGNLSAQKSDSLTFIQSKKMSADDLKKKKEGTFLTGIPDISSDPITGFGFGLRTNIYWNGSKSDSLFAYTPYLRKLKVNAAYYTSNAREIVLSLDMPYFKGTRWRIKVDFKAQQNPANLYFGNSELTLNNLQLPSNTNENQSFSTYEQYDKARKTLRAGNAGEANFVADVLSNRFRETEYMLNLKADYALGKGKWRAMLGYEIQHLSYKTFENTNIKAIDPVTNQEVDALNGLSLLKQDFENGLISGLNGGWVSIIQNALIYDTRDYEPNPTKGMYFEIANEYANRAIGSQFNFNKLLVQVKGFQKLPVGKRTVLAARLGMGNVFGNNAPFFEFQDQWSPDGSINALGGKQSLRGYRPNRFLSRAVAFSNIEVRAQFWETKIKKQHFAFALAPFFDFGTVRDDWKDFNFSKIKSSGGAGLRVAWNQSTIIFCDYGVSKEDQLFYFGIGQIF